MTRASRTRELHPGRAVTVRFRARRTLSLSPPTIRAIASCGFVHGARSLSLYPTIRAIASRRHAVLTCASTRSMAWSTRRICSSST